MNEEFFCLYKFFSNSFNDPSHPTSLMMMPMKPPDDTGEDTLPEDLKPALMLRDKNKSKSDAIKSCLTAGFQSYVVYSLG